MVLLQYKLVVIFLAVIVYFIKKDLYFILWACLMPLVFPLFVLRYSILDVEVFNSLVYATPTTFANVTLLIVLYEVVFNRKRIAITGLIGIFATLSIYLFFHALFTHFDVSNYVQEIRNLLNIIAPLLLILAQKNVLPSFRVSLIFLMAFFIIEFAWCLLESNQIYPYMIFYTGQVEGIKENLLCGTFHRFNAFANFLTTCYLFITIDFYCNRRMPKWLFIIITCFVLTMVVMSGAKMSLVLLFFEIIAGALLLTKSSKKGLLVLISLLIIILYLIAPYLIEYDGFTRMSEGFGDIANNDESTASLTQFILRNYFWTSPLWGCGRAWLGENAYGSVYALENFRADARLAYMLTEYGIIGLSLFLIYFFKIFKYLKKTFSTNILLVKSLKLSFAYFLILTLTEAGLFDINILPMLYVYYLMAANDVLKCTQK